MRATMAGKGAGGTRMVTRPAPLRNPARASRCALAQSDFNGNEAARTLLMAGKSR